MDFKWKNPYIDLSATKPALILNYEREGYDPKALARLKERLPEYRDIYCEIGSGSGAHLIGRAKRDPESLYIGIELRYKRAFRTAEKAEREGLTNLFVIRGNAHTLSSIIDEGALSGLYVNFPDPWSKEKWKKHRILSKENLLKFVPFLKANGFLSYKTDHEEYFRETVKILSDLPPYELKWNTDDLWESGYAEENIATEFEMLFRSKKLPIYALYALKSYSVSQ